MDGSEMTYRLGDAPEPVEFCMRALAGRLREVAAGPDEAFDAHLEAYRAIVHALWTFYDDALPAGPEPPGLSSWPEPDDRPAEVVAREHEAAMERATVAAVFRSRVIHMAQRLSYMAELSGPRAEAFARAIERAYRDPSHEKGGE